MPGHLRTRLKRVLTGNQDKKNAAKQAKPESDFYQPGEKMPPLKYRRAVDPEHKKKLEAFTSMAPTQQREFILAHGQQTSEPQKQL
jgi:hypothetical protein